jgi:hypothetical protein
MTQPEQSELFKPDEVYAAPFVDETANNPARMVGYLAKFCGDDDSRPVLAFINVTENFFQATNGHCFLQVDREELWIKVPEGAYRPVKDGKNWLLIANPGELNLPSLESYVQTQDVERFHFKKYDPKDGHGIALMLYELGKRKVVVSHQYLELLPPGDYEVRLGPTGSPVIFSNDTYTAGIAPIKLGASHA